MFTWCSSYGEEVDFHARVAAAFEVWVAVSPCADWSAEDLGDCATADADVWFLYGDPVDELPDGVAYVWHPTSGRTDITFNDMAFSTDEEVAAGTCDELFSIDLMLRRAVATQLGLPSRCELGEPCTEPEAEEGVLASTLPYCDARLPNVVDAAILRSVYGPVTWTPATDDIAGPTPLEACPTLEAVTDSGEGVTVAWDYGDGEAGEGLSDCHTWTEPGTYDVTADVTYTAGCSETIAYGTVVATEPGPEASGDDTGVGGSDGGCGCAGAPTRAGWFAALAGFGALTRRKMKGTRTSSACTVRG